MDGNPLQVLSLASLRTRTSMKWRTHPPEVLPLWVAEMDVLLAEPIVRAITDAIARGDTGYPAGTAYADALAEFAAARWRWDSLDVGRTAIVPDVMMGIVEIIRLVTAPGDPVVLNTPAYPPFYSFLEHADRRVVETELTSNLRLDHDALEAAFAQASRDARQAAAYLICNPHNPTGAVYSFEELADVAALADRYRVRVIADEIHAPLTMPGVEFVPYLTVPGSEDAFSLISASKGWNLAGLKAALVVAGSEAVGDLRRLPEEVSHGPSHVGVIAHTAALRDGGAWLDSLRVGLSNSRELVDHLLTRHLPMIKWCKPDGTYFAWLDCRALGLAEHPQAHTRGLVSSTAGPASVFLELGRVALSAGPAFGTAGANHVRLNMATSEEILTEAISRMGQAVAALAERET